jgi:hypothetical protein
MDIIMINPEKQEISKNDFFGEIYLKFDDICFPFENWTDFTSTLISCWHYSLFNELNPIFHFMDGPYFAKIKNISSSEYRIEMYKYSFEADEFLIDSVNILKIDLWKSLLNVFRVLLDLYEQKLSKDYHSISYYKKEIELLEISIASVLDSPRSP